MGSGWSYMVSVGNKLGMQRIYYLENKLEGRNLVFYFFIQKQFHF